MSKRLVPNKYNVGDIVYAKAFPKLGLVIKSYTDQMYYCEVQEDSERKELTYFEKELVEDLALVAKNKKGQVWENEGGGLK